MVLVERTMGAEVAERLARQAQRALDGGRRLRGQGDAGAFEHVDHAEQPDRVTAGNQVVEVGDHQLDW
ncbi:hypothetical protein D3C79_980620 [compost metagenome]